jgi:zinc protease
MENGLTVLVSGQSRLPFVTIKILFDAGSWRDPEEMPGLANLTAESMLLGTQRYEMAEINEKLDFLGAELGFACSRDFMTARLRVLTRHLPEAMAIFRDIIRSPVFPQEQVQRKSREIRAMIRSMKDQPDYVANRGFHQALFRQNPYGHPVEGTIEALSGIDREAVADFHNSYIRPNNAVMAVVGDADREMVENEVLAGLEKWGAGGEKGKGEEAVFEPSPESVRTNMPVSQANIVMGHAGIARGNENYYDVQVMNQILGGGGFSSRLLRAIRVREGLAYSVTSVFYAKRMGGSFRIIMQTKNESAKRAIDIAVSEMESMRASPPTEKEIETARQYLVGSFPMRFDSQSELAAYLVRIAYYGLGDDYLEKYPSYIREVSRQDVLEAAKTHLHPAKVIRSIAADLDKAGLR